MENDEKQSEDSPKYRLRAAAMKSLLENARQEGFSEQSSKLFSLLISNDEARASVFVFCQTPHPLPLISNIMNLLYDYFSKEKSVLLSESESLKIFQYLNELINKQLPSSFISKVDLNSLVLIDSVSHLASLFPSGVAQYMSMIPSNQNQLAFLLNTLSYCDDISQYISQLQPLISPKTSFSTLTFSELKLLSKHKEIENAPPVKTLISFCKSLPENEIFSYTMPTLLCVVGNRLQAQSLKEIPAFITYLIKKSKKDAEHLPDLCSFIDKVLEFPDSITLLRPLHEDLVTFFINNAQLTGVEINDELKDPTTYANKYIIKSFLNFISKFGLDPFDCLMQTRDTSIGTMILAYSAADSINFPKCEPPNSSTSEDNSESTQKMIESFLNPLISQIKQSFSPSYQFLIRVCGICAIKFESRASLRLLVSAISRGSNVAYDYLINGEIPFQMIFPEIVNNFKPGRIDALYIQALQVLLQSNQPSDLKLPVLSQSDEMIESKTNKSAFNDTDFDDPSLFAKLYYNEEKSDADTNDTNNPLSSSPTTETILFCNVASSVLDFPEFLPLLGPSAATISDRFAIDFISNIEKFKGKRSFNLAILSAYSNSIYSLDIDVVYSLALTFLMIERGQSMLFLGISLQRLPPEIILESLQKVTPYSHSNPVTFGKMVAIVARSYPSIAKSFIESFISSSATKRRVFFIFKTSETSEDTLVVVFYIIGYCSIFIDTKPFIDDFLPFATSFMNKYLVSTPKNQEVVKSSLFAIQKVCTSLQKYQTENDDHSFQFKDFLENYVTSTLKSEVDKMIKLNTNNNDGHSIDNNNDNSQLDSQYFSMILHALASLIPLKPILSSEKVQPLIECSSKLLQNSREKSSLFILESIENLCSKIIESNHSFDSLVSISLSLFPLFLRNSNWISVCSMMCGIYKKYDKEITSLDTNDLDQTTRNVSSIVVNSLPLIWTNECSQFIGQILYELISLFSRNRTPNVELNASSLFEFLSKNFLTSQTIEIISELIETLNDEKLLKMHHKNVAMTIKQLFEMKDFDYNQIDTKIVSSLVSASSNETGEEVSSILLDTIEIISKKKLESVLTVFVFNEKNKNLFNDEIYDEIIKRIVSDEKSAKSLVSYLASKIYSDENKSETELVNSDSLISFSTKIFPLLGDLLTSDIDNDTWSKLFVGIVKQTNSIESKPFQSLFKNNSQENNDACFYAKAVVSEHHSALPSILSYLPEKVTPCIRNLSLSLALFCPENCHSFLQYALNDLASFEQEDVEIVTRIFKSIDKKVWKDLADKFVSLIINFIDKSEISIDMEFINSGSKNKSDNKNENENEVEVESKNSKETKKDKPDDSNLNSNVSCSNDDTNNTSNTNSADEKDELCCGSNFCLKFVVCFLKNVDEKGKKLFWETTARQASENMKKYANVFLLISYDVEIDVTSLIPIIPKLAVSSGKSAEVSLLLHRIYKQIEKESNSNNNSNNDDLGGEGGGGDDVAILLLKTKALTEYKVEFLNKFVEMMINGESVSECIRCISSYINQIDESTADVIETLIMQLPKVNETDQKQISLMLQKVLI